VASPLAIALWPIEELSWAAAQPRAGDAGAAHLPDRVGGVLRHVRRLEHRFAVPGDNGDVINSVLAPLITLAALVIAFRLPFAVLGQAMKSGISPGINRGVTHIRNASYIREITRVGR
jgi:hypothetical protein